MIVLDHIRTSQPINCPHCGAAICNVSSSKWEMTGPDYWLSDSDRTTESRRLTPKQRAGISFENSLSVGNWSCCNRQYIVITACFVAGVADEDFRDVYFRENSGEPGLPVHYSARRNNQQWCVSCYTSPLGVVFCHTLNPVAWDDDSWLTANGVVRCVDGGAGSPWDYSAELLLTLWDDLHALTLANAAALPQ